MTIAESIPNRGDGERVPQALQERILRGIELFRARGHEIEWLSDDRCKVPSRSRAGRFHLVIFGADGERCGCADFQRHGKNLGACLHTVAALTTWAKRIEYRVDKRHDSRLGEYVWDVVETRAGQDRTVWSFRYVGTAYHAKWAIETECRGEAA